MIIQKESKFRGCKTCFLIKKNPWFSVKFMIWSSTQKVLLKLYLVDSKKTSNRVKFEWKERSWKQMQTAEFRSCHITDLSVSFCFHTCSCILTYKYTHRWLKVCTYIFQEMLLCLESIIIIIYVFTYKQSHGYSNQVAILLQNSTFADIPLLIFRHYIQKNTRIITSLVLS